MHKLELSQGKTTEPSTIRGDGLGHDLALWRQGLQALVPSDLQEPPLSFIKCTTSRSGARGALGSSYPNNPQLPKSQENSTPTFTSREVDHDSWSLL